MPPITMATSNWIERAIVKPSGPMVWITSARRPPPRPAQAADTTKARIWVRATGMPASDAAISSSRTARKLRPNRLRSRLASSTSAITAAARQM